MEHIPDMPDETLDVQPEAYFVEPPTAEQTRLGQTPKKKQVESTPQHLLAGDLKEACDAWGWTPYEGGGSLGLGSWMAKRFPRFSPTDYAAVLRQVRKETGDKTNYSTFYDSETARAHWPELVQNNEGRQAD